MNRPNNSDDQLSFLCDCTCPTPCLAFRANCSEFANSRLCRHPIRYADALRTHSIRACTTYEPMEGRDVAVRCSHALGERVHLRGGARCHAPHPLLPLNSRDRRRSTSACFQCDKWLHLGEHSSRACRRSTTRQSWSDGGQQKRFCTSCLEFAHGTSCRRAVHALVQKYTPHFLT